MTSEQTFGTLDDRAGRLWMAISAGGGLIVAALLAALRRRRARTPSAGAVSADWLRRHDQIAGRQGECG